MKRLLLSLLLIGVLGSVAFGLTTAFFSDKETSSNNSLQAGKVDLLIDNTSYLNGVLNQDTTWKSDNLPGHLFFNFNDIKPSDFGEDTISIKVEDNDAWACAEISLTKNDDNTCTEPELVDDPNCSEPNDNLKDGELAQNINMVFWADDGDNVLEDNEATTSAILAQGTAQKVLDGTKITLADSTKNIFGQTTGTPLKGGQTYHIGKAWCFGTLTLKPLTQDNVGVGSSFSPANSTGGVSCDGSKLNNATQTDVVMADVSFSAFQSRNNPNFTCGPLPSGSPSPSQTPSPTPQACNQADVMLVLDRSGSINPTELSQLKTAAKDFVDALGLSSTGIHGGQSSFATTATLDQQLTDSGTTLKTKIDALVSGGFTDLKDGIGLANGELASIRDRADGSSPDKMIIITDGHPNRPLPSSTAPAAAQTAATTAKGAGVEIWVVGVGSDVDATYLKTIATDNSHYFSVSDYSGLKTSLQNIDLCD